jgi:hypothetical protein
MELARLDYILETISHANWHGWQEDLLEDIALRRVDKGDSLYVSPWQEDILESLLERYMKAKEKGEC